MTSTNVLSSNWSGAEIQASAGQSLSAVSAQWTVPTVSQVPLNGIATSALASWVGLDGSGGSNDVCQAGVSATATTAANGQAGISYYAWDEWFPAGQNAISASAFKVNPGDTINVSVETTGVGATTAKFLFNDRTDAQTYQDNVTAPSGTSLVGNTAEWVAETPSYSEGAHAVQPPLGDLLGAPILFSDANATYTGGTAASLSNAQTIEMSSLGTSGIPDGTVEAYGSILPSTGSVLVTEADYWSGAATPIDPLFSNEYYY